MKTLSFACTDAVSNRLKSAMRDLDFTCRVYGTGSDASKLRLFDEVEFAYFNKLLLLRIAGPENGDFQFLGRIGP